MSNFKLRELLWSLEKSQWSEPHKRHVDLRPYIFREGEILSTLADLLLEYRACRREDIMPEYMILSDDQYYQSHDEAWRSRGPYLMGRSARTLMGVRIEVSKVEIPK